MWGTCNPTYRYFPQPLTCRNSGSGFITLDSYFYNDPLKYTIKQANLILNCASLLLSIFCRYWRQLPLRTTSNFSKTWHWFELSGVDRIMLQNRLSWFSTICLLGRQADGEIKTKVNSSQLCLAIESIQIYVKLHQRFTFICQLQSTMIVYNQNTWLANISMSKQHTFDILFREKLFPQWWRLQKSEENLTKHCQKR